MIGKQPVPLTGGVNAFKDPTMLEDNELQPSENFSTRVGGDPGTRPGLNFVQEINPAEPWDGRYGADYLRNDYLLWARSLRPRLFTFSGPGQLAAILQTSATKTIQVWSETSPTAFILYTLAPGQNWVWVPGVWDSSALGSRGGPYGFPLGVGNGPCSLFTFDGIVYAFDGMTPGCYITPADLDDTAESAPFKYNPVEWTTEQPKGFVPTGAAIVRDRAVYFIGTTLYWSDPNDPLAILDDAVTSGGQSVSNDETSPLTAIADMALSAAGSPNSSVIAAWTRNSMYMIQGEPLDSSAGPGEDYFGSLRITKMNIQAGCISQATVTRTPYGTFWVGADDVWWMPFGALPVRIGTKIRNVIKAIPPGLAYRICADYSNGYYRIALWAEGTGPDNDTPLNQMWWLDLNTVIPQNSDQAQWYGPHNLVNNDGLPAEGSTVNTSGIWAMARNQDGDLQFLQPWMVSNQEEFRTYGMSLAELQDGVGRDITAPFYPVSVPWTPTTAISEGDMYVPPGSSNGSVWICTTAGTTGATEPNWESSGSATRTDGTVTWTAKHWGGTPQELHSSYVQPAYMTANTIAMTLQSKEYSLEGEDGEGAGKEKLMDGAEITYTTDQPVRVTYTTAPHQTSNSRELDRFTE